MGPHVPRCQLLTGKAYYGWWAGKGSRFCGLKGQVVATSDGIPAEFYIHTRAESEQTSQRGLPLDRPAGSSLYPNAGYPDYLAESLFNEASQQQTARITRHKAFCYNTFAQISKTALVS